NRIVQGTVTVEDGSFPVAGVTVAALMSAAADAKSSCQKVRLELGRAVTDSDGQFTIEADDRDPEIARWACALRSCAEFEFQLVCLDDDETNLHESASLPYADGLSIEITLRQQEASPSQEDWMELGRRLEESQTARLDDIAGELATLAPRALFRSWSVQRRLAVLGQLEQAMLDPGTQSAQANVPLRFAQLEDEEKVAQLRERLRREDRPDLLEA